MRRHKGLLILCMLLVTLMIPQQAHAASGPSMTMSVSSGPPGTHIFITGSGFQAKEKVEPIWNYNGTGAIVPQKSFYFFNPIGFADLSGNISESFWAPTFASGTYTVAAKGLTSGLVATQQFTLTSLLDLGLYIGPPSSILRLQGWGLGYKEAVNIYWNWSPTNQGTFLAKASTDSKGDFGKAVAIPANVANGTYTVAAIGSTSHDVAQSIFTVGIFTPGAQPQATDWPMFGLNLQGTRNNTFEQTISTANVANLAVKYHSPAPLPNRSAGSPLLANGIVYIGSTEGVLTAYNQSNGAQLWTFDTPGPIYASPTIANGLAYFATVNIPTEQFIGNYMFALNAQTGQLVWDNYLALGGDWVTPTVSNGIVYVPSALREGKSGGVNAFDALTGSPVWQKFTNYGDWAPITVDPTGQHVYVAGGNPCYSATPPPTNDGCSGNLIDYNPTTGAANWTYKFPDISGDDDASTAPAYDNGVLFEGVKNGIFYAISATTGQVLWQYNTGQSGDYGIFSSAAIYNGTVYFASNDHYIHALDEQTGALKWEFKTGGFIYGSVSIANGVLYECGVDRIVRALDANTGQQLWSYNTGMPLSGGSPVISNGVLYVTGGDGSLYAFSINGL